MAGAERIKEYRYDPPGVEFIDRASGRRMRLVDDDAPQCSWRGWLVYWHEHAGNWVSLRLATADDRAVIAAAEAAR